MFGIFNRGKREPEATEVLRRLSLEQGVVRMELERALLRFNTRLTLREQVVLVGKPPGLEESMRSGDRVRFRVPWSRGFEVRMEIAALHVNLKDGAGGFVCHMPKGRAFPVQRRTERFNTSRFSNVHLRLPSVGLDFPVVDLSMEGCRVQAHTRPGLEYLRARRRIREGLILVGERFHIPLQSLVPQTRTGDRIGMTFTPQATPATSRALKTLLGVLAMQEVESFAARTA